MAWIRRRRRERQSGPSASYDNVILATTMARIAEEEEENTAHPRRGSVVGRRTIPRDRYSGYCRLMEDYFVDNPVYGDNLFRRRLVLPLLDLFTQSTRLD